MKKCYLINLILMAMALGRTDALAQITGQVWLDVNGNKQVPDVIQGQVSIKAYDSFGKVLAYSVIDVEGRYMLDIPQGRQVRIEFGNLPNGVGPSEGNAQKYFATSPAEVSLSLYNPANFAGEKPRAVQAVYALGSLTNRGLDSVSSLVGYHATPSDTVEYTSMAVVKSTGAIWGLAYDRAKKQLFSSALAKRHSALGALGTGGIYVTSLDGNVTKPFVNLDELGFKTLPTVLNRALSNELGVADHDSLMFSQVGKIGLGGLDISDDSRFLYTVNLYDRHLYRIKLHDDGSAPTARDIARYELRFKNYAGGDARPFAVKYYNGQVYVGVVCDAQLSKKVQDLQAYVYVVDADETEPAEARFREVTRFSLNYPRGVIDYNVKGWYPWTDNYLQTLVPGQSGWMIYPQPILADIEFDSDGSLIVSLMDRLGHQTGDGQLYRPNATGSFLTARGISGGDVLRLGRQKKKFETEQNGEIGARISEGHDNGEGPGGGEFYVDDSFSNSGINWHQETATGGLAILPSEGRLLVSVREPDQYTTGGVKWFSNETGASTGALSVFPGGMKPGYFWKSNNVGDIELITPLPATEIGDRIWLDNDGDGMQGADEPVLAGVELGLYRDKQLVGETKSDETGRYSFNNENVAESIKSRTNYEVRASLKQSIGTLNLTAAKKGGSSELDSDALINKDGFASVAFTTTNPGENIHHLDIGFQCNDKPQTIANVICSNNQLQVRLNGHKEEQRYDLTPSARYEGVAIYASASKISKDGMITEAALIEDKPYEATLRVYASSGCYQDQFITSASSPGCDYIPENMELKSPYTLSIYPNPSTGPLQLTYRGNTSDGDIVVEMTGQNGRVIKTVSAKLQNCYYRQPLNVSGYATGTYLLTVKEGTRHTTKNIVKN